MASVNQFFSAVGEYYIVNGAAHPEDKGKITGGWAYAACRCIAEWFCSR